MNNFTIDKSANCGDNPTAITFCLPVYNVSEYIRDCIDSILTETDGINAEIICIDDCSSDDSWKVLNEICAENPVCICYQNEKNRGVSYTRNRALNLARGKYIWFVDPDDILCPGVVTCFLEKAYKEKADVILGNYARVQEDFSIKNAGFYRPSAIEFKKSEEVVLPEDSTGTVMCAIWCGIFKTEFLLNNQLFFREDMIAQEDTLFYYEFEQCSPIILKTNAVCYLYRQRGTSVMHQKTEARMQDYYRSMRIMLDVYNDYWCKKTYRDKAVLQNKILHSHENVCSCLAKCTDESFVRENFRELKKLGYYPYRFRTETLKRKGSKISAVFDFLLPIEICFWMVHFIYSLVNKKRFK